MAWALVSGAAGVIADRKFQVREEIENAMWDGAGLVRDRGGLESTLAVIDSCTERLGNVTIPATKLRKPGIG